MTEGMDQGRSARNSPRPYMARGARFLVVVVSMGLMLGGVIGGYLIGRELAYRPLAEATRLIQQLQPESQRLKRTIIDQNVKLVALQANLTNVQATLAAIMPSENTYIINPNQSLIVAGGHLTIGLIGSPSNDNVNININGKPHLLATGDILKIAPDPLTACQVSVQSFDMFKAILIASCAAVKSQ